LEARSEHINLDIGGGYRDGAYGFAHIYRTPRHAVAPGQYLLLDPATTQRLTAADPVANPCRRPDDAARIHVGVIRVGGIGDDLMLAASCLAFKRRFPQAHITAFTRDNTGILTGHPAIDRAVFGCGPRWFDVVRDLREHFDIFVDLRYVAKVWAFRPEYRKYANQCRERFEPLAWYYHNWYESNARLAELGRNLVELTSHTICCPGGADDVRLWLRQEDRKLVRMMNGRRYAIIHNGAGGSVVSKLWPLAHWVALVAWLRAQGIEVWQVGWPSEQLVPGAQDLRGFSTLRETAGLIEGAQLVVCEEGSIAHMAQAVGQRNVVVLYGPTPPVCFGYPGHVAVQTLLECRGCWYTNMAWHARCPRGYEGFPCMAAITPKMAAEACARLIGGKDDPE